jgi:hypothetical protein
MPPTRLGYGTIVAALALLAFASPTTATPIGQAPATPTATPGPPTAPGSPSPTAVAGPGVTPSPMPAGSLPPTLTSQDLPPVYDEVFFSLADVPLGPIVGQVVMDAFVRRQLGPGPELMLSVGVRAPDFAGLQSLPAVQRRTHDAMADSFLKAVDSFVGLRAGFVSGASQQAETFRSDREAVEPPALEAGAWMVMDNYHYQRGAAEGDGAIGTFGRGDIVSILIVESTDGRANEALGQYARIVDAHMLQAIQSSP